MHFVYACSQGLACCGPAWPGLGPTPIRTKAAPGRSLANLEKQKFPFCEMRTPHASFSRRYFSISCIDMQSAERLT